MNPNIALIHATYAAIPPVEAAFTQDWPEATTVSLIAEDLTRMLAEASHQTAAIQTRIRELSLFATRANVEGILYTCSAFGDSIEAARRDSNIPVLKPNEAMFEEALELTGELGERLGGRIGMLVTFEPAIPSMTAEFDEMVAKHSANSTLTTHFVPGALEAITAGETEKHHQLLAKAAQDLPPYDVLMLAQFSMSGAKSQVEGAVNAKVLTSPGSAIAKLKALIAVNEEPNAEI